MELLSFRVGLYTAWNCGWLDVIFYCGYGTSAVVESLKRSCSMAVFKVPDEQ